MKSTPSGHFMIQEPTTNDLVVMTSLGKEVARFNSAMKFNFRKIESNDSCDVYSERSLFWGD